MSKIKLFATDIDNTLINSEEKVTLRVKEAILEAKKQGVKIVLCTGRPLSGIKHILQDLGLDNQDDEFVVCFGGALVQSTSGKVLYQKELSYAEYMELEFLARKYDIYLQMESMDRIYVANRDLSLYSSQISNRTSLPISFRTPEEMKDIHSIKAMYISEPDKLIKLENDMYAGKFDNLVERLTFSKSKPFLFEANAKNVTKAQGLQVLSHELKIKPTEMMTIGDQQNDESMIELAGVGVAMGNGISTLKQKADYITTDNNHDGVAAALEKFVLKG